MIQSYENFIGGQWVSAVSGKTFSTVNPADTRETIAHYSQGGSADFAAATAAARPQAMPLRRLTGMPM